jgi:outer membrane protein TolC
MKTAISKSLGLMLFLASIAGLNAAPQTNGATDLELGLQNMLIDLPTVLKLANARNLDVQIARERLAEAKAASESATMEFLPWLAPGVVYRRHDNLLQDVGGNIIDVHKDSYAPGLTLAGQIELGDAIYHSLAARQTEKAAGQGVEAQRQISILAAVQGYFDLVKAQGRIGVAREAQRIADNLAEQLTRAVEAGLAYRGDEMRARIQSGQAEISAHQAMEQQRLAGARLIEILHLEATVQLTARDSEPIPLTLVDTNASFSSLVQQALRSRPEMKQNQAQVAAAKAVKNGAVYGPIIPTLGGSAYVGGLGGGPDGGPSRFGDSEDYTAYLTWRIGPGGLFDIGRNHQARSQWESSRLNGQKVQDEIVREVMEDIIRTRSFGDQLNVARRNLALTVEAQKLAEQRKEFAIGAVLENIQTQQDLTRARNDFLTLAAEYNKSQYALQKATGNLLCEPDKPAPTGAEQPK